MTDKEPVNNPESTPDSPSSPHANEKLDAQDVWRAGMGALVTGYQEGSRLFERLVHTGKEAIQQGSAPEVNASTDQDNLRQRVSQQVQKARGVANDSLSRIEQVFNQRVSRSLDALGIVSAESLQDIEQRLQAIERRLDQLEKH